MRVAAVSAVVASASGFMPSAPSLAPSWSWTQRAACIASALRSAYTLSMGAAPCVVVHMRSPASDTACHASPAVPDTRPLPHPTQYSCCRRPRYRAAAHGVVAAVVAPSGAGLGGSPRWQHPPGPGVLALALGSRLPCPHVHAD